MTRPPEDEADVASESALLVAAEERESGVHTVPADGMRWHNRLDGAVVLRHRRRDDAVIAGEAMAQSLGVPHVVHAVHTSEQEGTRNGQ